METVYLEGCPDCGRDELTLDDDEQVYCANVRCGWRP